MRTISLILSLFLGSVPAAALETIIAESSNGHFIAVQGRSNKIVAIDTNNNEIASFQASGFSKAFLSDNGTVLVTINHYKYDSDYTKVYYDSTNSVLSSLSPVGRMALNMYSRERPESKPRDYPLILFWNDGPNIVSYLFRRNQKVLNFNRQHRWSIEEADRTNLTAFRDFAYRFLDRRTNALVEFSDTQSRLSAPSFWKTEDAIQLVKQTRSLAADHSEQKLASSRLMTIEPRFGNDREILKVSFPAYLSFRDRVKSSRHLDLMIENKSVLPIPLLILFLDSSDSIIGGANIKAMPVRERVSIYCDILPDFVSRVRIIRNVAQNGKVERNFDLTDGPNSFRAIFE